MQLGELQSQLDRFSNRGVKLVALSVDPPEHSRAMIRRMGLGLSLAFDKNQMVQKAYGVQNPDTQELALHAVFIVSEERRIFYRKIASRRPKSQELLDAIDYYQGNYPVSDQPIRHDGTVFAFPTNDFQALVELATNSVLPTSIDDRKLSTVVDLIVKGDLDDATVEYKKVIQSFADSHNEQQLLAAAAWVVRTTLDFPDEAMLTGRALNQALVLRRNLQEINKPGDRELLEVQKDLDTLRTTVRRNAVNWRLHAAKTTLRSYRELSKAALH